MFSAPRIQRGPFKQAMKSGLPLRPEAARDAEVVRHVRHIIEAQWSGKRLQSEWGLLDRIRTDNARLAVLLW